LLVNGEPVETAFAGSFVKEGWGDAERAATRVSDGTWTKGDAVGVYMLPSSSYDLAGAVWKNRKQVIDANNKMTPDGIANKLYYPLNGSDVRFVAYYPYATSPTKTDSLNKVSFDFADQGTKEKKEAKDFMFHRGTEDYSKAYPNASLGFHHKFSKILMTVKRGTGGPSLSDLTVTLGGMPQSATVDLDKLAQQQSGDIAVGTQAATITAATLSSSETTATVEAIVAPHTGTGNFAGRTFTFNAGGEEKIYELPDDVEFESGYAYHFTFTLVPVTPQLPTQVSDGMTNCYMVVPGDTKSFKVSRAYTHTGTGFTTTLHVGSEYTGSFTAAVVWEDADVINGTPTVSGSGNAAVVSVKTNSGTQGNAVVAIKKGSDIVWSYHIWVTDYDATDESKWYTNTYNTNNNGSSFVFMDRNLGATQAGTGYGKGTGLFYQWGRKDPFPATLAPGATQPGGGTFTATTTSSSKGTITYTLQYPNTFITASSSPYDWYYGSSRNDTLWGHSGLKTIYDPCPSGWRVPKNSGMSSSTSPWYGFTKSNSGSWSYGYNWGANAVYPAAGNRLNSSGSIADVGANGRFWSASPYRNGSYITSYLGFDSNSVNVDSNYFYSRAYGLSVRCVRE
jgi:hypothetical protein